jgi:hypothetical protein
MDEGWFRDSEIATRGVSGRHRHISPICNDPEQLTMWLLAFKSIQMFWLTVGPSSAAAVPPLLASIEWTEP